VKADIALRLLYQLYQRGQLVASPIHADMLPQLVRMELVMDLSALEFAGTIWELINRGRIAPLIAYIRSDKALRPVPVGNSNSNILVV
jgi:hypothetical protein